MEGVDVRRGAAPARSAVSYADSADPGDVNTVYEMRRTERTTPAGFIWQSTNTDLTGLGLHFLHGFGIVGQLSRNITIDDTRFRSEPGSWKHSASFADFVQMSSVAGSVQVTNSLFDNPHDDPINVHGTYVQVTDVDEDRRQLTLRYMHPETAGFPQFYPGDTLRLVDKETLLPSPGSTYTVTSVDGPTGEDTSHSLTDMTVTVDRKIAEQVTKDQFVAENLTYTPEVTISGNTFQSVPTRGILVTTPRRTLIERNRFVQVSMASIYISDDANSWYESGSVSDVTIRHNMFERLGTSQPVVFVDPMIKTRVPGQPVHRNIAITANDFALLPGTQLVKAASTSGLSFTKNAVSHYAPTTPVDPSAVSDTALFAFTASDDVTLTDNDYAPGFNLRADIDDMDADQIDVADGIRINDDHITSDASDEATLAPGFSWVREAPGDWEAQSRRQVSLKSGVDGLWAGQNSAQNILLTQLEEQQISRASVVLSAATQSSYEEAGLILYQGDDDYVELMRKHNDGSPTLSLVTETRGKPDESARVEAPESDRITLELVRDGDEYTASYSTDGEDFTKIGTRTVEGIDPDARVGVLAAGASDDDTTFTFTDFAVNGSSTPFFSSLPEQSSPVLDAALKTIDWTGTDGDHDDVPLTGILNASEQTTDVRATFTAAQETTDIRVVFNDEPVSPGSDGTYTFPLSSGANVVEVETLDEAGARQVYRRVILSDQPQTVPGAEHACSPDGDAGDDEDTGNNKDTGDDSSGSEHESPAPAPDKERPQNETPQRGGGDGTSADSVSSAENGHQTDDQTPGVLPFTGADNWLLAGSLVALLCIGLGVFLRMRRKMR